MKFLIKYIVLISSLSPISLHAQDTRLYNYNTIGWYNYFGTFKLNQKFSVHTEYQFRRTEIIKNWQQSLLRIGLNYQLNPKLQVRIGYAWIETFPYGEITINGTDKTFTEHRLFEAVTCTDKISKVDLSHRFILEQRWVGRYSDPTLTKEDQYPLLNRFRYMFRFQIPLNGKEIKDKYPYMAAFEEIFIGFGKNVNENIFDQNRIGILIGYRFNALVRIEAGYLNQILQLGREVNNRNVFQKNNGIILNANFTFNFAKK
jgi:hypothetical protein